MITVTCETCGRTEFGHNEALLKVELYKQDWYLTNGHSLCYACLDEAVDQYVEAKDNELA